MTTSPPPLPPAGKVGDQQAVPSATDRDRRRLQVDAAAQEEEVRSPRY